MIQPIQPAAALDGPTTDHLRVHVRIQSQNQT